MANDVTFQHKAYECALYRWELVDAVCAGSKAIKDKTTEYLPKPNPLDCSREAEARYKDYLRRSVFYNATGRTLQGMVGTIFRKSPEVELPEGLAYALADIDGMGNGINQQAQSTTEEVLKNGRRGLLVDYPQTDAPQSRAQMETMGIRATVATYDAQSIINWRTEKYGGIHKLSLVVLKECAEEVTEDGFGVDEVEQYRVLRLTDGVYTQELWRKQADGGGWHLYQEPFAPLRNGSFWDVIPFQFVGAQNNDSSIDEAPLYDMAELNVAHYRNSAEYEDTCFMCGQIQPVMTGVDESWVQMLEEKGIQVGSRVMLPLPVDGDFGFRQAAPNTIPFEAMKHKEEQMVALGARLITQNGQVKTATEASGDSEKDSSVLSIVAGNVSAAYTQCLKWMAEFMVAGDTGYYELNRDYGIYALDAPLISALVQLWQTGKWPEADLFAILKRYGLVDPEKPDEDIKDELDSQGAGPGLTDNDAIS